MQSVWGGRGTDRQDNSCRTTSILVVVKERFNWQLEQRVSRPDPSYQTQDASWPVGREQQAVAASGSEADLGVAYTNVGANCYTLQVAAGDLGLRETRGRTQT